MVTVHCQVCGKPIQTPPSRKGRTKFCSREHYAQWLSENNRGANHPMFGKNHRPESIEKMKRSQQGVARKGPLSSNWKGGRYKSRGYWYVIQPNGRHALEHRLVMEQVLGRPLLDSEKVHHRNGKKDDNRPENLTVTDNADHKKTHQAVLKELRASRLENDILRALVFKFCEMTSPEAG